MKRLIIALAALMVIAALFGAVAHPATAQGTSTTYIVQPGDNLYRISLKFGVSMDAIARANGIVNASFIFVGQRLIIPGVAGPVAGVVSTEQANQAGGVSPTVAPTTAPVSVVVSTEQATTVAPTAAPTAIPIAPPSNPDTYTVQPGDNLYRIALKFNTTMAVLMQLNNISNPNLIFVGEVLKLPPGSGGGGQAPAPGATPGTVQTPSATTVPNTAGNVGFAFGLRVELRGQDTAPVVSSIQDLGVSWVKQEIAWKLYEPTKGAIDFAKLDAVVTSLNTSGAKLMLTVARAPDWARNSTTEDGPPTDFNDFANFIGALASRYKGRVLAYEIWDQPNIRREWNGRPLSAASYVELLRVGFTAIKAADPSIIVVSAGLAPTGFNDGVNAINDRTFLRQAYTAGLASYSDAVGVHPNGWANPPDSTCCNASPGVSGWFADRSFYFRDTLADYRQIMVQNNDGGTFLWATEFGWGASEGVIPDPGQVNQNFGFVKLINQAQQAQYVTRAFEIGRTLGFVGPMFLSNLNYCALVGDQPGAPDFELCFYSLQDATGAARPAYTAVKGARK